MAKNKVNSFLVCWDIEGLVGVVSFAPLNKAIEQYEQDRLFLILKSPDLVDPGNPAEKHIRQIIEPILLRAHKNPAQCYEIYTIQTTSGVTELSLWEMFSINFQESAATVRENGTLIYSAKDI